MEEMPISEGVLSLYDPLSKMTKEILVENGNIVIEDLLMSSSNTVVDTSQPFIPSAAIQNLTADKIVTGTLKGISMHSEGTTLVENIPPPGSPPSWTEIPAFVDIKDGEVRAWYNESSQDIHEAILSGGQITLATKYDTTYESRATLSGEGGRFSSDFAGSFNEVFLSGDTIRFSRNNVANNIISSMPNGDMRIESEGIIDLYPGKITGEEFRLRGSGSPVFSQRQDGTEGSWISTANSIAFRNSRGGWSNKFIVASNNHSFVNLNMENNNIINQSDIRLKTNPIENNTDILSMFKDLKWYDFKWIESGKSDFGLIAQEIREIFPQVVEVDEDTPEKYLGINSTLLEKYSWQAIGQLATHQDTQNQRIIELELEVQKLKKQLEAG